MSRRPLCRGLTQTPRSAARTFAIDIPVTDVIAGSNTVQLGSDADLVYFDVDIDLVDVANGVPVLPGAERGYPN